VLEAMTQTQVFLESMALPAAGYAKPTAYHITITVLLEHNNDTIILSANASALSSG